MTLNEFKSWFSGYVENIEGAPTEEHLARIKEVLETTQEKKDFAFPKPTRMYDERWQDKYDELTPIVTLSGSA